jgi:hypothetical protein
VLSFFFFLYFKKLKFAKFGLGVSFLLVAQSSPFVQLQYISYEKTLNQVHLQNTRFTDTTHKLTYKQTKNNSTKISYTHTHNILSSKELVAGQSRPMGGSQRVGVIFSDDSPTLKPFYHAFRMINSLKGSFFTSKF